METSAHPLVEALATGLPVVASDLAVDREVCGDAAFYFDASDADELARSLVSTLQDAPGLAMKRQLGEQQVKLYDWSRTAANTLNVYRALSNR